LRKKTRFNTTLSQTEQVMRELFPPKKDDVVEFEAQWDGLHRKFKGKVLEVRKNENGRDCYLIQITSMSPTTKSTWWKREPERMLIRGHKRLKILEKD